MIDLKEYPLAEALRERLTTAAEMERCISDNDVTMARIKAVTEIAVCLETKEDGKARFSSEDTRKAATAVRLADNEEYGSAGFDRDQANYKRAIALAEAEAIKAAIKLACATERIGE